MSTSRIIVSACLVLLVAAPLGARAEEGNSEDFAKRMLAVKSVDQKPYACFVRSYDKAHMAHHPKQTVTDMKLLVSAERVEEDPQLYYSFRMSLKFRNRKGEFAADSSCGHAEMSETKGEGMQLTCGAECGGGGLTIALGASDKALIVKVDSIGITRGDKPGDDSGLALSGGDDRVFRLDRVSNDDCAALIREAEKAAQTAAADSN